MFDFTKEQIIAIEQPGCMVITACPGSGKTAVISEKIRNEVRTLRPYEGVIAITFTRKASEELERRSREGGLDTKASFFGTIDSFCLKEIIFPFWKHVFDYTKEELTPKYHGDLSAEEQGLIDKDYDVNDLSEENFLDLVNSFYQSKTIYFPTITRLADHIFRSSKACGNYIKSRYKSIYIDEYQDSSEPQHSLFKRIVEAGLNGIAVGDLDQSIYGWRGSSPEYLKELMRTTSFTHCTVTLNHRCHASISNYANRLLNKSFVLLPSSETQIYHYDVNGDQRDIAIRLNTLIPSILKNNPDLKNSDLAVLVKNNDSLDHLRQHLTIPSRIYGKNPLDGLESRIGSLWAELLKFRYDASILVDQIITLIPSHTTWKRVELTAAREIIKATRVLENEYLFDHLIRISQDFVDQPKEAEIAALKLTIEDRETIKQYLPVSDAEIQCMTIHKSKGLEFAIVIHLDLYEWILPRMERDRDTGKTYYTSLEQDLNLHYVAVTRAKKKCVLMWSSKRVNRFGKQFNASPSQFLEREGIEGLFKKIATYNPKSP